MFNLISLVTCLEYFDFISFSLFCRSIPFATKYIGPLQLIVGYSGRFIGSILVAYFTKKYDNKKILTISIWSITISTLIISLLPNTNFSLYLLFLLRWIQGLAFAIEFPIGSIVGRRHSSVNGATLGYIFASFLFLTIKSTFPAQLLQSFGWRIPCIIGGVVGLYVAIQRTRNFTESLNKKQKLFKYFSIFILLCVFYMNIDKMVSLINPKMLFSVFVLGISYFFILSQTESPLWIQFKSMVKPIKMKIINNNIFLVIAYFAHIFYALVQSMWQTKLVSEGAKFTDINTVSLFVPIIISYLYKNNPLIVKLLRIPIFILFLRVLPVESMLIDFTDSQNLLIFNQVIVTTYMLLGLNYSSKLFKERGYLAPITYNGIALLASMAVGSRLSPNIQVLLNWIFKPIMGISLLN